MKKNDLINEIMAAANLSKTQATDALNAIETAQVRAIKRGEEALVPGLGKVLVVNREARTSRNPITGETVEVPARKVLKYRGSVTLKRDLKAGV